MYDAQDEIAQLKLEVEQLRKALGERQQLSAPNLPSLRDNYEFVIDLARFSEGLLPKPRSGRNITSMSVPGNRSVKMMRWSNGSKKKNFGECATAASSVNARSSSLRKRQTSSTPS